MLRNIALKDHWREQRTFVRRVILGGIIALVLIAVVVARLINLEQSLDVLVNMHQFSSAGVTVINRF